MTFALKTICGARAHCGACRSADAGLFRVAAAAAFALPVDFACPEGLAFGFEGHADLPGGVTVATAAAPHGQVETTTLIDQVCRRCDRFSDDSGVPEGTTLETEKIPEQLPHEQFQNHFIRRVSRLLLGQDSSQTAIEGQRTGATLQGEVRDDIRDRDALLLCAAINETFLAQWCAWKFGPDVKPPRLELCEHEEVEPSDRGGVFKQAREIGLPLVTEQVYREMRLERPEGVADVLQPTAAALNSELQKTLSAAPTNPALPPAAEPTPLQREPLSGVQITSAIDVLSKLREGVLEPLPATELLEALGFEKERAARMVKSTPRGDKDSSADKAFKRDMIRAFLADGTVTDVLYNATDIRALLSEANIPLEADYSEPWLPVQTASGATVTGNPLRDEEGDIVGSQIEPAASPLGQSASSGAAATYAIGGDTEDGADATAGKGGDGPLNRMPSANSRTLKTRPRIGFAAAGSVEPAATPPSAADSPLSQTYFEQHSKAAQVLAEQADAAGGSDLEKAQQFQAGLPDLLHAIDSAPLAKVIHARTFGAFCAGRIDTGNRIARPAAGSVRARTVEAHAGGAAGTTPDLSRAQFKEAIDHFAQRNDLVTKPEFLRLQGLDRARAWTVARVTDLGVLKDLHDAVGNVIEGGQTWRDFRESLDQIMEWSSPDGTAPAAGWIKSLRWDEQRGLVAGPIEWTQRAKDLIATKEYRYFSPTWIVRPSDRRAFMLGPVALTNDPASLNITPIAAKNLATRVAGPRLVFVLGQAAGQGADMSLPEILGLSPDATLPEVLAAIDDGNRVRVATALGLPQQTSILELRMAIEDAANGAGGNGLGGSGGGGGNGTPLGEGNKTALAALAAELGVEPEALRARLKTGGAPPAGAVSAADFGAALERMAKLDNQLAENEFDRLVLSDGKGKVPPAMRAGMFTLFKADRAKFVETLKALPVQAGATSALETNGDGGNPSSALQSDADPDPAKEWDRNSKLREEFSNNKDDWMAYFEANKGGRVQMPAATRNLVEAR